MRGILSRQGPVAAHFACVIRGAVLDLAVSRNRPDGPAVYSRDSNTGDAMSRRHLVMLLVIVCAGATAGLFARAADLSGTWVGTTQVPDVGEDRLKLDLKADGASYTGLMTDTAGMVIANPITNVKVEGAQLTFDISVNNGSATIPVHVTLKAEGETLTGSWATDEGMSAPVALAREKKQAGAPSGAPASAQA
jgi:hypothetical protein